MKIVAVGLFSVRVAWSALFMATSSDVYTEWWSVKRLLKVLRTGFWICTAKEVLPVLGSFEPSVYICMCVL